MTIRTQNRQQLLVIAAAIVVGLWIGDQWFVTPLTRLWHERSARIAGLEKSIQRGSRLLSSERAIRNAWDSMRTNTLPQEASAAEGRVLNAFDRWSQESRISITSIKPQWKRSNDDYMTLECRVDAFGGMATITRFLYEIESDPLALKIESLELTSRDNDGSQITVGLLVSGLLLNPGER